MVDSATPNFKLRDHPYPLSVTVYSTYSAYTFQIFRHFIVRNARKHRAVISSPNLRFLDLREIGWDGGIGSIWLRIGTSGGLL
jgi:hypothetical protein